MAFRNMTVAMTVTVAFAVAMDVSSDPVVRNETASIVALNSVARLDALSKNITRQKDGIYQALPEFPDLIIDGQFIQAPDTVNQLLCYMTTIFEKLSPAPGVKSVITFPCGRSLTIDRTLIGRGSHASVFNVIPDDGGEPTEVFKLTHPTLSALASVRKDIKASRFWMKEAPPLQYAYVNKYTHYDESGIYRCAEKSNGVTLTKILLHLNLFSFEYQEGSTEPTVVYHSDALEVSAVKQKVDLIEKALLELLDVMKHNPGHYTSLSPNNLHITFTSSDDEKVAEVTQVELVDIGVNTEHRPYYEKIHSFEDYLRSVHDRNRIYKYLTKQDMTYDVVSLAEWQNQSPYKK